MWRGGAGRRCMGSRYRRKRLGRRWRGRGCLLAGVVRGQIRIRRKDNGEYAESAEYAEKSGRVVTFDRKSPPIAKGAKGGAPSSSIDGWTTSDRRAQAGVPVPQSTLRREMKNGRSWDRPFCFWARKKDYLVPLFLGDAFCSVAKRVFALGGTGTSCLKTMSLALTSLP